MSPHWVLGEDPSAVGEALAQRVEGLVLQALAERGEATLLLSGGETPAPFLAALARRALPWDQVVVAPADERVVPADHPRSNFGALRRALPLARVLPVVPSPPPLPHRLDLVVLGLGGDGHTASLFPGSDQLDAAVAADAPDWVALTAPGAPEPRVSASLNRLLSTRALIWHLGGPAKQDVLRRALGPGPSAELPARYVLRGWAARGEPLKVFTWPPLPPSSPMEPQ